MRGLNWGILRTKMGRQRSGEEKEWMELTIVS